MAKPTLKSKEFEHKGIIYFFELQDELYDLTVDIFFISPDHQPRKFMGVCEELPERVKVPTEYISSRYIREGGNSTPEQTVDEFLIECHKDAIKMIDKLKEFEEKVNMDFHLFAAKISDVK